MPSALCLVYVCIGLDIGFQNDSITNTGEKHVVEKEGNGHDDQDLTRSFNFPVFFEIQNGLITINILFTNFLDSLAV